MKLFFSVQRWYLNSKHILLNKKTLELDDPWILEPNNVDKDFFIQNKKTKKVLEAGSTGQTWFADKKAVDEQLHMSYHEWLWSKRWIDHTYFILENRAVLGGVLTSISETAFPIIKGNITLR